MNLNLARKWRSKQFDEIVGQPLAMRLLKNSLYRNLIFPVYLLSGTRGTGKTSTARIFAAALNCKKLPEFQKDPQQQPLPCLSCDSCKAMQQMNHPDVIEIDAASNTGVDNVRQIIEAASFIPVLGGKKIYLIDEAHMLSKAAFNAFLKILEEPPQTVVFMLVTTDPHKIIPTVLSRCFQVFFDPIKPAEVVRHLTFIGEQEGIAAEPEALLLIAQETEGCMRDALNLLERLRALPELTGTGSSSLITKEMVLTILGSIDDDRIGQLLLAIVAGNHSQVLDTWQRLEMNRFNPGSVWEKLVETLRRSLWLKQAVAPDEMPISQVLQNVVDTASYEHLISMLEICYTHELAFAKTSAPGTLLELLILKMVTPEKEGAAPKRESSTPRIEVPAQAKKQVALRSLTSQPSTSVESVKSTLGISEVAAQQINPQDHKEASLEKNVQPEVSQDASSETVGSWSTCLQELELMQDPLVVSIFKQCAAHVHNEQEKTLELTFSQDLIFFKDWLKNTEKVWKPIIEKFFGVGTELRPKFDGISTKQRPVISVPIRPAKPVVQTATQVQNTVTQKVTPAQAVPRSSAQTNAPVKKSSFEQRSPQKTPSQEPVGKAVSPNGLKIGSMVTEAFPGRLLVLDTSKESL